MRRLVAPRWLTLGLTAALLLMSACRSSTDYQYYLLAGGDGGPGEAARPSGQIVGLGPFAWPDYLNRSQIVTRLSDNELDVAEFHRWAEPLEQSFLAALAAEVASRARAGRVVVFPWSGRPELDCRVRGEVTRFDTDASGETVLLVNWTVARGPEAPETAHRGRYRSSARPGDYASIAAALSDTVSGFAADLAAACTGA